MAKLYNLARMTTTTTGSDVITLGTAVAGRLDFETAGVSDGETISYGIVEGNSSEVGRGVYGGSGSTLTRSVLNSTNSGSPIVLAGSGHVFINALAEDIGNTIIYSSADTSNPPTDAELDSAYGTPASVGYGFTRILNDAGSGSNVYLVASDGTYWWHVAMTKST